MDILPQVFSSNFENPEHTVVIRSNTEGQNLLVYYIITKEIYSKPNVTLQFLDLNNSFSGKM